MATFNNTATGGSIVGTKKFDGLSQTTRSWFGMTTAPNGNVYACMNNGDIYIQTGGAGNFIALSQTTRLWIGMTATTNGNVYACSQNSGIFMQTNSDTAINRIGSNDIATGGVVCGSSAIVGIRTSKIATGGVVCGSSAIVRIRTSKTATGGVVCGSSAIVGIISNRTASGGIVCGGITLNSEIDLVLAGGGVVCGSSAIVAIIGNRTASGGIVCGGIALNSKINLFLVAGGVVCCSVIAEIKMNNKVYIRDLIAGDNVFFLQHTKLTAAVVQEVIISSLDIFYVIKKAKTSKWTVGQSMSFLVHESRVIPADDQESYVLAQKIFY